MEDILRFDSVEVSFNGDVAVRDVSLALAPGQILGIVGESGSGKSTLLKAAMGLLGPGGMVTRGDIWFEGKNIPELSGEELRRVRGAGVGMVFQDAGASLCPIRTIGAQITESLQAHVEIADDEARARALALFDRLGFEDAGRIWGSYPFELSGGMNQRVGIAIALLLEPRVLLADEPTSALDVAVQKQVVQELAGLRDAFGTSVVIVTHDIGVVRAVADDVLVMREGRAVESGAAAQVLEAPQQAYTKELLAAVPRLRRTPRAAARAKTDARREA